MTQEAAFKIMAILFLVGILGIGYNIIIEKDINDWKNHTYSTAPLVSVLSIIIYLICVELNYKP
jgi:uncharacterized protein YebE (UPF0316 family)